MTQVGQEIIIIIIDDDRSMSQAIERLLAAAGLRSRAYSSAEAFLDSDSGSDAAVLILDNQLPGLSGMDLMRQLKAAGQSPPTILITGQDRPGCREQAQNAGATAYLTKPFAGSELLQAIRGQLPAG